MSVWGVGVVCMLNEWLGILGNTTHPRYMLSVCFRLGTIGSNPDFMNRSIVDGLMFPEPDPVSWTSAA